MEIDSIDRQILAVLQIEGRITNADLAQRVGLTPGPTLVRVGKLQTCGVISRYCAILSPQELGFQVTAFISVILKQHGKAASEAFVRAVGQMSQVLECHHIAGEEDFLLKVVAKNPRDYERFVLDELCELPEVQRIQTTFVLSSPKIDTAMPVNHLGNSDGD